ncbi:conserved hypothetical protein [uncultured Desulfobacterium sp.]|uniref:HD-GYP domain-containing protein n=1 Tax=uncultured Desulfobacterium sp. TaxID=201089 RepID=A0A445N3U5_9BACT|nr:conserved hypothetical protein [uncultured Desulfobacterium sp.]
MPDDKFRINIFDMVTSIARVVDMMSPAIGNHNLQVSYLAYRMGEGLGLAVEDRNELLVAGALHDIGAFSLKEWNDLLEFECTMPGRHSLAGYFLLKDFKPFSSVSEMIRYHHVPWKDSDNFSTTVQSVPLGSHIIHLADRISVRIEKAKPVLGQVPDICDAISAGRNKDFAPQAVDIMLDLASHDYIWMELSSDFLEKILQRNFMNRTRELVIDEFLDFATLICRLIDFKSEFTATHSTGVATTAVEIARLCGFSKYECKLIKIAACLHDLGKVAIPSEILEKKGKLSESEWHVMRSHAYYSYQILEPFDALGAVCSWGTLHQERLNGTGYPFGYKVDELPLGARIMAAADVFTAITENRPYRAGMDKKSAIAVLTSMATNGELDQVIVNLILKNYDEINQIRDASQHEATKNFTEFQKMIDSVYPEMNK